MDLQLAGRVALVTGASKGIGLAVTRTLLDEGARVAAVSRKSNGDLDALAGPNLLHIAADLMDPDAPARAVEQTVEAFGGLDVVVNNAGGPPPGASLPRFGFLTLDDADWRDMVEFNVLAVVRTLRAALPHLLNSDAASIVNVSSGNARRPVPMNYDYNAAKAAVTNLTKGLSEEYGPQGVRVNTVSPGPVRTNWWTDEGGAADIIAGATGTDRDSVLDGGAAEMMSLTTGRLATPQEIADVVALLVSPRSGSTTGADFAVDSGFLKEI
ncbi:NAD(P)-dependent dehydrogenase (short-subunit alcohol dehydrogenase family) [Actinomadura pelletieri DSM 43383]|uniref:NAD(P)-dependent dehydrogenase (Short-subunit alcohol dehydrogenase family) n=1 Tax=Actinomadura pelletieri DSM 43383 TaxID=1120940 RepID=A0A495QYF8_9ACTN|nr:SDR family oxidoreductase [Actinomadura pelletieri]RKS79235.1 NAD(P)-dependent dehydrogenase (short-subunit alcohol dehydrogenase family) [Actinomadura pelletieri DSM 43383]